MILLSRTIRSCRATTHSDLATLKKPINSTYYCHKHYKICKPLSSILSWWKRYSKDTIKRLNEFDYLRTNSYQICLTGDSRTINLYDVLEKNKSVFSKHLKSKKIDGIFSSPPYVGLIDYHEQHAYAYDLLGYDRKDKLEIGPLFNGKGKEAKESLHWLILIGEANIALVPRTDEIKKENKEIIYIFSAIIRNYKNKNNL